MQIHRHIARCALTVAVTSLLAAPLAVAGPAYAGEGSQPHNELRNAGFEEGGNGVPKGWDIASGSADVSRSDDSRTGSSSLRVAFNEDGAVTVRQILKKQQLATFDATVWTRSDGLQGGAVALGSKDWRRTSIPVSSDWSPVVVRGVETSAGDLEIRFELTGTAGQSVLIDDVSVLPGQSTEDFLVGGDLTQLNYIESLGGVFRDEAGVVRDPVELMAENGVKLARLRLYNNTGPENHRIGFPESYLEDGFQDPEDVLKLARRAQDAGMQIQLTFHYSDYWSNGEIQDIPLEWRDVTQLPHEEAVKALETHVADYTASFLQRMEDQGTPPTYVSLGNEIVGGLLHPYGHSWQAGGSFDVLARFLTAGANAVHRTLPDAKVIIHLDDAGNQGKYEWFFGELEKRKVPFDVIGSSYYPFWTKKDVPTAAAFFQWADERFDKPVMIMETGFNWNTTTHEGLKGQLNDNGPYGEDPQSQRDFFRELYAAVKALPSGTVLGDIYWDPVFLGVPGAGWEVGKQNFVSNSTIFDFDGKALPVFQAFRENAGSARELCLPAQASAVAREASGPCRS